MNRMLIGRKTDRFQWILAAAVAAVLAVIAITYLSKSDSPQAKNGILDLTAWDLQVQGNLPLDGEWEFYPNRLLEPKDFAGENPSPEGGLLNVPGVWNGPDMKALGAGTYRLTVLLRPGLDEQLAIQKQIIRFSDKFYVNGELLGQSGIPSESRRDYKPGNAPYTIYFTAPADGRLEIVIQAANYEYRQGGGLFFSPTLGLIGNIVMDRQVQISLEWAGVIVLFIFGFFFIVLFGLFNRNTGFLFFGIFFAIFGIMIFLNGQRSFLEMFPDAPFQLSWKLKDVTLNVTYPITILYTNSLLKLGRWKRFLQAAAALYAAYAVCIVLLPYSVYSAFLEYFIYALPFFFGLLVFVLLRMYRKRDYGVFDRQEMQLFIAAIMCIVLFPINIFVSFSDASDIAARALTDVLVLAFIVLALMMVARRYLSLYTSMEGLTDQLKRSDERKDEFLLQTSHELNTPLNGIINLSQSVLDDPARTPNAKRTREKLLLIRNMAFRMSNMVHDVIDLAQLKDERLVVSRERVDLQACASNLFSVYGFLANEKGVRLDSRIGPDSMYARADDRRLLQVLSNILDLCLRHMEQSLLQVSATSLGEEILLTVEAMQHRKPSEQQLESEGFGIGLSIAGELVRLMEGRLEWKEARDGEGIRFEIFLPAYKAEADSPHEKEPQSAETLVAASSEGGEGGRGEDQSILVVAAPANLELLVNLLAIEGYRVETAHSAAEAIEAMRESGPPPDLLLLDVMMPGGESYEVGRWIRRTYSPIDLPILYLIARNTPADIEAVLSAGGNDFIVKPLDAGEIRVRIRTLLAMKNLAKEAAASEMAFLQSQIKPHFLYNALGTIMSLCYTDGPRAGELLAVLSRYLRIIFHQDQRSDAVTLAQEVELVQAYADIEQARFGSRLELNIEIDDALLSVPVMSLTIQPLVENAIRHGVAKKVDGGTVRLAIEKAGQYVRVVVEDNGIGMTADEVRRLLEGGQGEEGVGFRNILKRVLHLSGKPPEVESAPNVGTRVTLWLPASDSKDRHGRDKDDTSVAGR
ncbi:hybrid sensor histidine kinase/response regulator [Cohnella thailandensis]|uniref:histidine kinase n=1 Tax=Cohnella thailandensis TaxID=557557 RepID=A0A841SX31_9BACL|nr:ATP-binding protein [Cohnella thailandensis]MBB6634400.1 histidine kinase [Cohnella thailandensis]MBP1972100.1 signal transduction histidine kinase [Cohnella thailandensis]